MNIAQLVAFLKLEQRRARLTESREPTIEEILAEIEKHSKIQTTCPSCGETRTVLQIREILNVPINVDILVAVRDLASARDLGVRRGQIERDPNW